RVFSFMGQINLYDRYVFQIPGISHTHPIREIIEEELNKFGLAPNFYTIRLQKSRFVPLQELYDYEDQKWKLIDI
ncbi:MAG: hypothetical protein ACTSQ0_06025, partial [Candidatus Heimdallarchaeota archaeon]